MTERASMDAIAYTWALLSYYGFDLYRYRLPEVIEIWLKEFPANWLLLAVIEALYQGRYKAISVHSILRFWQRRGEPVCHFNHEFERIVCAKLPETMMPSQTWLVQVTNPPVEQLQNLSLESNQLCQQERLDSPSLVPPPTRRKITHQPIRQFTPPIESSEFHSKLQSVAKIDPDSPNL